MGRYKLDENNKRKLRQVRISNEEMIRLGNPDSTWMREAMFKWKTIEDFFAMLDDEGLQFEEWFEKQYEILYLNGNRYSNKGRLMRILEDKRVWLKKN